MFVSAVGLVRSLCESSPTAFEVFNRENVISSIITATDLKQYSLPVVAAVCELAMRCVVFCGWFLFMVDVHSLYCYRDGIKICELKCYRLYMPILSD